MREPLSEGAREASHSWILSMVDGLLLLAEKHMNLCWMLTDASTSDGRQNLEEGTTRRSERIEMLKCSL